MAKVTYIRGETGPNGRYSDGEEVSTVTSFWHIRKPHTSRATLCGVQFARPHGVNTQVKKPKETARNRTICKACVRIQIGKDPVFDKTTDSKSSRNPKDIGTIANSQRFTLFGEWNAGKKVA